MGGSFETVILDTSADAEDARQAVELRCAGRSGIEATGKHAPAACASPFRPVRDSLTRDDLGG